MISTRNSPMNTPVVLILFNRPMAVREVFERIAEAKPEVLFLIADGPRAGHAADALKCQEARDIVSDVTWPAQVYVNFSQINLGCGRRISSGLDWVFSRVSEAIILEDDCVPSPRFFPFCEELLSRYRNDERVGMISGDNFVSNRLSCRDSYYFSRYAHVWGWATWRRTWSLFDFQLTRWPRFRDAGLMREISRRPETVRFWTHMFDHQIQHHSAWASRLVFTCFVNGLLNIIPKENLVSNRGWGEDATHAIDVSSPLANLPIGQIEFPLRHPEFFIPFRQADEYTEETQFSL
jgi:hypothetical protein